jgi:hypothetical protein
LLMLSEEFKELSIPTKENEAISSVSPKDRSKAQLSFGEKRGEQQQKLL